MQGDTQKLILLELLQATVRSWGLVIAGGCFGLAAALVAVQYMPRIYQASATIFADAEKLPPEFVRSTVADEIDVRLGTLRESVLKPQHLERVAMAVYPADSAGTLREEFRGSIPARVGLHFDRRTRLINISFLDGNPERAATAANLLAQLLVEENARYRTGRAAETAEFIRSELANVDQQLARQKDAIVDYQRRHPFSGSEYRVQHEQTIRDLESKLADKDKQIATARTRLRTIEAQAEQSRLAVRATPGEATASGASSSSANGEIARLEADLKKKLLTYSENHPEVRALRRQIEDLRAASRAESKVAGEPPSPPSTQVPGDGPPIDIWATQERAAKLELGRLEDERTQLSDNLSRVRGYLASGPAVERELDDMNATLDVLQRKYQDLQAKLETAQTGQRAEETALGNPFEITQKAAPPSTPVSPKTLPIVGAGGACGLALFLAPVLVPIVIRPVITSKARIEAISDLAVLVAIPMIPSPEAQRIRRRAIYKNLGLASAAILTLAVVVSLKILDVL